MHIAVALQVERSFLPSLFDFRAAFTAMSLAFADIIKVGRTYMQDATPLTMGQEFSGYEAQLRLCENHIKQALGPVHTLAMGGTAVGTGRNSHPQFRSDSDRGIDDDLCAGHGP
jgi:fumarate hydratase class II